MSEKYDLYLTEHKANVEKGFDWLCENLPELVETVKMHSGLVDLEHQICFAHDASKTDQDEYEAYDRYYYGGNRSFGVVQEFNHAWLKHIHRNPHHWQYWVLINDDPDEGEIILDMPHNYILEMICDWWAFSWSKGNPREIFSWWREHEKYIKLSKSTRMHVVDILSEIHHKLDELEGIGEEKENVQ